MIGDCIGYCSSSNDRNDSLEAENYEPCLSEHDEIDNVDEVGSGRPRRQKHTPRYISDYVLDS